MQVLLIFPVAFYALVVPLVFIAWLNFFRHNDQPLSRREKQMSLIVISIAALLWPVVLPFAYLDVLDKLKRTSNAARLYQKLLKMPKPPVTVEDEVRFLNN